MKFIITNAQEDSINVIVSSTNMQTQTVAHLLKEIYLSNEILSKAINFEAYQEIVQLSYQNVVLAPHALLKDVFNTQTSADVTLTLGLAQNPDPIQGISRSDLTLVKPPIIPEDLYCPLSGQVFYHPVKYHYGEEKKNGKIIREKTSCTVEKESLLNVAHTQGKCPYTRKPLSVRAVEALETDIAKQQEVADFFVDYEESGYYGQLKKEQYQSPCSTSTTPQSNVTTRPALVEVDDDIDDLAAINLVLQENQRDQGGNEDIHPTGEPLDIEDLLSLENPPLPTQAQISSQITFLSEDRDNRRNTEGSIARRAPQALNRDLRPTPFA